jgi:hypothetical protein
MGLILGCIRRTWKGVVTAILFGMALELGGEMARYGCSSISILLDRVYEYAPADTARAIPENAMT